VKVPTELYSGFRENNTHPGHAPLITDLTFRSISDHVIDQGSEWFDPDEVQQGDTVYLNLWYLDWFHSEIHDLIKHPYILISCDVGHCHPSPSAQKLLYDPKLAAWFCRNILFSYHPKLFQIPMGQSERFFSYLCLSDLEELARQKPFKKKHLLYMNFLPRDHGDRKKIVRLFENEPYCFSRNKSGFYDVLPLLEYYKELSLSMFALSPVGLEHDCMRTWEAMTLDCIPIIEHSFLDPLFVDLPVVTVHDWTEINEPFLREKYEALKNRKTEKVYFGYWHDQIKEMQKRIRMGDLSSSQLEKTSWEEQDLNDLISILREEDGKKPFLIYKGFLTTVRSLQIANAAPYFYIYLRDPFLDQETLNDFWKYTENFWLLRKSNKIKLISEEEFNNKFANYNPFLISPAPIFLDLTYQRSSLLSDFGNFRHRLLSDLSDLYQNMGPGGLLCGNCASDSYVGEVLQQLSEKYPLNMRRRGNFWFFRK
jgi:hypothetical protein